MESTIHLPLNDADQTVTFADQPTRRALLTRAEHRAQSVFK